MDPITLATAAVTALAPYLVKAGETTASEIAKGALGAGAALFRVLWTRWQDKPDAKRHLEAFVATPDAAKADLQSAIAVEVAMDPTFGAALRTMLGGGDPEVFVRQVARDTEEVTGAKIKEIRAGRLDIDQDLTNVTTSVGVEADKLG